MQLDLDKIKIASMTTSDAAFSYVVDEAEKILQTNREKFSDLFPIVKYIIDRSSSVALLVNNKRLWDAEIVFRSVIEALSKFLIIITQESEEKRNHKLDEYWLVIDQMERLRHSHEMEKIVKHNNVADIDKFRDMILPDDIKKQLESRITKDVRKRLSNDWSFNDILLKLALNKDLDPFIALEVLHFFWKMSSHLAHADKVAMMSIKLRDDIEIGRDLKVTTQHLKLLKGITSMCFWVITLLAKDIKDQTKAQELTDKFLEYNNYMTEIHQLVADESNRQGIF